MSYALPVLKRWLIFGFNADFGFTAVHGFMAVFCSLTSWLHSGMCIVHCAEVIRPQRRTGVTPRK